MEILTHDKINLNEFHEPGGNAPPRFSHFVEQTGRYKHNASDYNTLADIEVEGYQHEISTVTPNNCSIFFL